MAWDWHLQLHKDYAGVLEDCLNQAAALHLHQNHAGDSGDGPDQVTALQLHKDHAGDSKDGLDQTAVFHLCHMCQNKTKSLKSRDKLSYS